MVLPPQSSTDQLVLNTLKAGEDTMARVKSSQYDGLADQQAQTGTFYQQLQNWKTYIWSKSGI